jgi:hypothetical protein
LKVQACADSPWSARRFVSVILYTCAEFDEGVATEATWETGLF